MAANDVRSLLMGFRGYSKYRSTGKYRSTPLRTRADAMLARPITS